MKTTLHKIFLLAFVAVFSAASLNAQVKEIWTKEIPGSFLWQKVFTSGNFLYTNAEGLSKVNNETGKTIWTLKQFPNIAIENVDELQGSSLLSAVKEGATYLIDPFTGEIKFDSRASGISELKDKLVLYKSNGLFLSGKDLAQKPIILLVDINKGQVMWKMQEEFGSIISINELSKTELLLVTVFNNYKINITNGSVIWKNAISAESEKVANMGGALGGLVKDIANAAADKSDIVVRYFENPTKTVFVLGVEKKENKPSPDGKTTVVVYKNSYHAYNMSDGKRYWNTAIEMSGKISQCAFYNDNFIIMPSDELTTKVNMFDLNTGVGKWGKKGKGTKVNGGVTGCYLANDKMMIVTSKKGKKSLYLLDVNTGLPAFKKPTKIIGDISQTYLTSKGILYQTSNEINVIDPTTGVLGFERSIYTNPSLCRATEDKLFVYDKSQGKIIAIDLMTCTITNISQNSVYADGKEEFSALELRVDGFILTASQNIAFISKEGATVFSKYFPAPKESGLMQALLYAQAARAAYIGVRSAQAANAFNDAARQTTNATGQQVLGSFGDAYGDYSKQATGFALQSIQQAQARFKATSQGRDFVIILTDTDHGNVLAMVSKTSGQIMGEVNLGREKTPKYTVDDVTGQIFMENKKGNIVSYKLN